MTNYLRDETGASLVKCDCCGRTVPSIQIHEHHMVKRSTGGADSQDNIAFIDSYCHTAIHQIEMALKNQKRRAFVPDLLGRLYPDNKQAQRNCLYMATTAALGYDPDAPPPLADYAQWDTEELVHLTPPPTVHPTTRQQVKIVAKELKNPRTGRALGVGGYLRLLVEADLRKRGFRVVPASDLEKTKKPADCAANQQPLSGSKT
jgi:hypothetical protein